jgi:hypothetical protein
VFSFGPKSNGGAFIRGTLLERTFGRLSELDIMLRALQSGIDALTFFLDTHPNQQHKLVTITVPSDVAINRALDASPHGDQAESIKILERISGLIDKYPNINITFLWLPKKSQFVGFKRTKQLALEAVRTANLTNVNEPQTLSNQMKQAEHAAIAAWAEQYNQSPLTSMAYRVALTTPPDGKTHHTFQTKLPTIPLTTENTTAAPAAEGPKATFSRLTYSTFYRFITGHAFTGEYTQRFFPQHTPDQVACQCGEPLQTVEHVIMHCPIFTNARLKHLTTNGRARSFRELLETPKRVQKLLRFLEETQACNKPRAVREPD